MQRGERDTFCTLLRFFALFVTSKEDKKTGSPSNITAWWPLIQKC